MTSLSTTHLNVSWSPLKCSEVVTQYTVYLARNKQSPGLSQLSYKTNGSNLSLKVGPTLPYEEVIVKVSATTAHGEMAWSKGVWAQPGKGSKCI